MNQLKPCYRFILMLLGIDLVTGCHVPKDKPEYHDPQWLSGSWIRLDSRYEPAFDVKTQRNSWKLMSFKKGKMILSDVIQVEDHREKYVIDTCCLACYDYAANVYYEQDGDDLLVVFWDNPYFPGVFDRYARQTGSARQDRVAKDMGTMEDEIYQIISVEKRCLETHTNSPFHPRLKHGKSSGSAGAIRHEPSE